MRSGHLISLPRLPQVVFHLLAEPHLGAPAVLTPAPQARAGNLMVATCPH